MQPLALEPPPSNMSWIVPSICELITPRPIPGSQQGEYDHTRAARDRPAAPRLPAPDSPQRPIPANIWTLLARR